MFFASFWFLLYFSAVTSLEMHEILKELSWPLKLKVLNEISAPEEKNLHSKWSTSVSPITKKGELRPPQIPPGLPDQPDPVHPADAEPNHPGNVVPGHAESVPPGEIVPGQPDQVESAPPKDVVPNNPGHGEPVPSGDVVPGQPKNPEPVIPDVPVFPNVEPTQENPDVGVSIKAKPDLRSQTNERQVGIQLLRAGRRSNQDEDDERDMRLKLFRLMYETVRDSDLKVKRAELIKEHYANSSTFEIGYLVGDITDKANIIIDISTTLKRFQKEWKPIEHINAYEQISNQAIEITHLIDLVRVVNKRESDNT